MRFRNLIFTLSLGFLLLGRNTYAQDATHLVDVVYGHKLGVALTMDVFKPEKPNGIGVLWMVSGGWVSNHNSISPQIAKVFTDQGQTVFEVVHGSQPKFTLPEIMLDINRAVRFVRFHAKEYGVDPDRLGISGGSAGGHLSTMMGCYGTEGNPNASDPVDKVSSRVQCVACFYPPTDFLNYGEEGKAAFDNPMLRPYYPVFGLPESAPREDKVKVLRSLSPIYGDLKSAPPTFIIHGEADTLVPIQQSERLLGKLKDAGVETKLERRPGKGHGWAGQEKDAILLADWFTSHLGKKAAN
ncbi:MAG: alpha/beta hydrolase [Chthonomonadales bacterium]